MISSERFLMKTCDYPDNEPQILNMLSKFNLKLKNPETTITSILELVSTVLGGIFTIDELKNRLWIFTRCISRKKAPNLPYWFQKLVSKAEPCFNKIFKGKYIFCNAPLLTLACLLFKIRLIVYNKTHAGLTKQYFGSHKNPKSLVFMENSNFYLVQKINFEQLIEYRTKYSLTTSLDTMDYPPYSRLNPTGSKDFNLNNEKINLSICKGFDNGKHFSYSKKKLINYRFSYPSIHFDHVLPMSIESSSYNNDSAFDDVYVNSETHIPSAMQFSVQNIDPDIYCPSLMDCPPTIPIPLYTEYIPPSFKDKILYESQDYSMGRLKFYNEQKGFGFIISNDGAAIFVHKDDLIRANINTCQLEYIGGFYDIVLRYRCIEYKGKAKNNNKAIDLHVVDVKAVV